MSGIPVKVCTGCESELPLEEFSKKKGRRLQARCRACVADDQALRRGRQREQAAAKPAAVPPFDISVYPRWVAPGARHE